MLSCRDLSETATDYLEGNLTLRQRASVKFHLLMCKHCRAYVDQLAKTVALLKTANDDRSDGAPPPAILEVFRKTTGKP